MGFLMAIGALVSTVIYYVLLQVGLFALTVLPCRCPYCYACCSWMGVRVSTVVYLQPVAGALLVVLLLCLWLVLLDWLSMKQPCWLLCSPA